MSQKQPPHSGDWRFRIERNHLHFPEIGGVGNGSRHFEVLLGITVHTTNFFTCLGYDYRHTGVFGKRSQ